MHATSTVPSPHRARWAAIGAAVAVSLGAGGLGIVKAVSPEGASAFVPINPCRLIDTRPGDGHVGPQTGPIPENTAITIDGWGDVDGECNLPSDTTGLQLNVTAVDATQLTNLRFYPTGTETPTVSNLNPAPGAPPTPNAVTVSLNAEGKFEVYNRFGSVNVIIDVAGYYGAHQHDGTDIIDESLSGDDIQDGTLTGADIQSNSIGPEDLRAEAGVAYTAVNLNPSLRLDAPRTVASVKVAVPADGYVTAVADINWFAGNDAQPDRARCQLSKSETFDSTQPWFRLNDIYPATATTFLLHTTAHRTLEVSVADNTGSIITGIGQNIYLICETATGTIDISTVNLTVMYFPTEYNAGPLILMPFPTLDEG